MKPTEDAPWRLRTGLLPAGDPLASALEELADRPRTHRLRAVGLIDVATGEVGPPCDLEVVDGRIGDRAPTVSTNDGTTPCQWFAAPGFVDAHAHVSSVGDLVGLLVYGVTAFRQMWGEPGPSYHKELAELSRAGLGLGAVLRAATTEAHKVMRWSEYDTDAANLVLYRRPPVDVGVFARPDSVLVDGVLLDGDDLDHLWGMRLGAAGLDADVWPRGELDPSVPGVQREKERAGAG